MANTRRRRKQAQVRVVDLLLHQLGNDIYPATVVIHRWGKPIARLMREEDYQEATRLMADHLKHLANEAVVNAIPLEQVVSYLSERRGREINPRHYELGKLIAPHRPPLSAPIRRGRRSRPRIGGRLCVVAT